MPILSLISAAAVMAGAGSWAADAPRSLDSEIIAPGYFSSNSSEMFFRNEMSIDAPRARGEISRLFVLNERSRGFCEQDFKLQAGCLFAGERHEKEKAWAIEPGDRVSETSDGDDTELAIVPVPSAISLMLSALAGLAFAGRGRRHSR